MARPDESQKRTWRFRLDDKTILEVSAPQGATEKQVRGRGRWSLIAGALIAALALSAVALASVYTDKADYAPGEVVTISGDNSNDAGYLAGETVVVDVSGPNGYGAACEGVADEAGAWSCQVTLWDTYLAGGDYAYTATGQESGVNESGTFTDGTVTAAPITVKESTCNTAQTTFTLGDTVCASANISVTGGGISSFRFEWVDPSGTVDHVDEISANPLAPGVYDRTFIPDETGTWTVRTCAPSSSPCTGGTTLDSETFLVEADGNGVSTGQLNCHYHIGLDHNSAEYTDDGYVSASPNKHDFLVHCTLEADGEITDIKVQGGFTVSKLKDQPAYAYVVDTCANSGTDHVVNISNKSNVSTSNLSSLADDTCDVIVSITGAQWKAGLDQKLTGSWSAVYTDSDGVNQRSVAPETPLLVDVG